MSTSAESARENARQSDGRFGSHPASESGALLDPALTVPPTSAEESAPGDRSALYDLQEDAAGGDRRQRFAQHFTRGQRVRLTRHHGQGSSGIPSGRMLKNPKTTTGWVIETPSHGAVHVSDEKTGEVSTLLSAPAADSGVRTADGVDYSVEYDDAGDTVRWDMERLEHEDGLEVVNPPTAQALNESLDAHADAMTSVPPRTIATHMGLNESTRRFVEARIVRDDWEQEADESDFEYRMRVSNRDKLRQGLKDSDRLSTHLDEHCQAGIGANTMRISTEDFAHSVRPGQEVQFTELRVASDSPTQMNYTSRLDSASGGSFDFECGDPGEGWHRHIKPDNYVVGEDMHGNYIFTERSTGIPDFALTPVDEVRRAGD